MSDASRREIVRRYYQAMCDLRTGRGEESAVAKIELLMNKAEITVDINPTVGCQPAQGRGDRHAGSCH